jgi:hypothetical protein
VCVSSSMDTGKRLGARDRDGDAGVLMGGGISL